MDKIDLYNWPRFYEDMDIPVTERDAHLADAEAMAPFLEIQTGFLTRHGSWGVFWYLPRSTGNLRPLFTAPLDSVPADKLALGIWNRGDMTTQGPWPAPWRTMRRIMGPEAYKARRKALEPPPWAGLEPKKGDAAIARVGDAAQWELVKVETAEDVCVLTVRHVTRNVSDAFDTYPVHPDRTEGFDHMWKNGDVRGISKGDLRLRIYNAWQHASAEGRKIAKKRFVANMRKGRKTQKASKKQLTE